MIYRRWKDSFVVGSCEGRSRNLRRSFCGRKTRWRYYYSAFVRWLYLLPSRLIGYRAAFAGSRPRIVDPAKIVVSTKWRVQTMRRLVNWLSFYFLRFFRWKKPKTEVLTYCIRTIDASSVQLSFLFSYVPLYCVLYSSVSSPFVIFPSFISFSRKTPRCKRFRRGLFLNKKKDDLGNKIKSNWSIVCVCVSRFLCMYEFVETVRLRVKGKRIER